MTKRVGVAITINGRLEKIDWYGHAQVFHGAMGWITAGWNPGSLARKTVGVDRTAAS